MRYTKKDLRTVPYEMLHGPLIINEFTLQQQQMSMNTIFDPWTQKINFSKYK